MDSRAVRFQPMDGSTYFSRSGPNAKAWLSGSMPKYSGNQNGY